MFEFLLSVMLLTPTPGTGTVTWSDTAPAVNQGQAMRLKAQVTGRPAADCKPPLASLPPGRNGTLRFEDAGVRYEGTESQSGSLVVRGSGARPVVLTGSRSSGGLWSVGNDGKCIGTWTPES